MARRKKFFIANWQENYAGLILGAIIVIILGLLVANFITKRGEQIGEGEQTTLEEKMATFEGYMVKEGDSLSKIVQNQYGDMDLWPVIARVNNLANPNLIFVGATLELPSTSEVEEVRILMTQTSYEVKEGDTIFEIAQLMYGDGSRWPVIARANGIGRLPNGNPLIFAGGTLTIPR